MTPAELFCVALAVYFEARNQPLAGQAAVAQVVMNRIEDPRFPNTPCEVVYDGGEHTKYHCQFSFYCDGVSDRPFNIRAFRRASTIARLASSRTLPDYSKGATHYHAVSVHPAWTTSMDPVGIIGHHIFYIEGPRK